MLTLVPHKDLGARINMKNLLFFIFLAISCTLAATAPYNLDVQADYLKLLLRSAKLRPMVNDELNLSPNQDEFSNIVRSVAGKRGK